MHDKTKGGRSQPPSAGFTPVPDIVIRDFDLLTAVVLARIWRFGQGPKKKCIAAKYTVAKSLGISAKTVQRRLKLLVSEDYLIDLTPDRQHMPHDYALTETAKLMMRNSLSRTQEKNSRENGRTESPTRRDRESHLVGQRVQPGGTESPTRWDIESTIETREETSKKEVKENDDDHDHPPSFTFSDDDFEAVKTAWLETIGRISKKQKMKLTKHVQKYSCSSVVEAIDKMSDYARNPNMVYLEKILDSSNGNQRKKNYVPNEFAEFIE